LSTRPSRARRERPELKTGLAVEDLISLRGKALEHWQIRGCSATPTIQEAFFSALQRVPRSRLVRLVFSDGRSESTVEQSALFSWRVLQKTPGKVGRPRTENISDAISDYRELRPALAALRELLRAGRVQHREASDLSGLKTHIGALADRFTVSRGSLAVRVEGAEHGLELPLSIEDFWAGSFVPHLIARTFVAKFYRVSESQLRQRTYQRKVQKPSVRN
jgi:hypothetical protein